MDGPRSGGHGWPERRVAKRPTNQGRGQRRAQARMAGAAEVRGVDRTTSVRTTGPRCRLRHGCRKKTGEAWMPNAVSDDARATPTPRNPAQSLKRVCLRFFFDIATPSVWRPRCFLVHSRVTVPSEWIRFTPVSKGFSTYGVGSPPLFVRRIRSPFPLVLLMAAPRF